MGNVMIYATASFFVLLFGTLFFLVGFATASWIVPFDNIPSARQITGIGMWMFCFERYAIGGSIEQDQEVQGDRHQGCYHLFHREMKKFYSYSEIITGWFIALQVALSVVLFTAFLASLLMLLYLTSCCRNNGKTNKTCYLWTVTVIGLVSGYVCAGSVITFGYLTIDGWKFLREPKNYHLDWSYFIACFGGGIILIGSMLSAIAAILHQSETRVRRPTYNRSVQMVNLNNRY